MRYRIDFEYIDFFVCLRAWCLIFYFVLLLYMRIIWFPFNCILSYDVIFFFSSSREKENNILWQNRDKRKSNCSHRQQKKWEIKNQTSSSSKNIEINIFEINSIMHTSSQHSACVCHSIICGTYISKMFFSLHDAWVSWELLVLWKWRPWNGLKTTVLFLFRVCPLGCFSCIEHWHCGW